MLVLDIILLLLWFGSIIAFVVGVTWLLLCVVKKKNVFKPVVLMLCSLIMFILVCVVIVVMNSNQSSEQEKKTDALFEEYKKSKEDIIKDGPDTAGYVDMHLDAIEENYFDIKSSKSWDEALNKDGFETVVLAIAFFDTHYEENTVGKEIGTSGWHALESLFKDDGKFEGYMDLFKKSYEATGRTIYHKYPAGEYQVGIDIEQGEYVFFATKAHGYFKLLKVADSDDLDDYVGNDFFSYNSMMAIKDGEYLTLKDCYAVPIEEVETLPIEKATMFKVGFQIPAGDYKLVVDKDEDRKYYTVYGDSRHSVFVTAGDPQKDSYISVKDGQYLQLGGCHIEQE